MFKFFIKTFFIIIISLSLLYLGMYLNKQGISGEFIKPIFLENIKIIPNYYNAINSSPEKIEILFNNEEYKEIIDNRSNALKKGIIETNNLSWVKCKIKYQDNTFKAKIRLKGDYIDHLKGDKWSFRVKLKKDGRIFGMKKFSLQNPKTRNYIYEWLFHKALQRENIIHLRYKFVNITINGKNKGIYALEEHFDNIMLENNKIKPSVILKFNEDYFWYNNAKPKNCNKISESWQSSNIDYFNKKHTSYNEFNIAKNMLEQHKNGNLSTSEVFDIEKLSMYIAICDLMDGGHAWNWNNIRFYYNKDTKKIEPIGYDKGRGYYINTLLLCERRKGYYNELWHKRFYSDTIFVKKYIEKLNIVSNKEYINSLLDSLNNELYTNLNILYKDYPYFNYTDKYFKANQDFIKKMLNPISPLYGFFTVKNDTTYNVKIANRHYLPIVLIKIYDKRNIIKKFNHEIIPMKEINNPLIYKNYIFNIQNKTKEKYLYIEYKILGLNQIYNSKIFIQP